MLLNGLWTGVGQSAVATPASIFFGGVAKKGKETFQGQKCKKMCVKCSKNCHFYAEIVKFELILTPLFELILGGKWGGGRKYGGRQMPPFPL